MRTTSPLSNMEISSPRSSGESSNLSRTVSRSPGRRPLDYLSGLAIVLGLQIGSGIFSTPSAILSKAGSPILALAVWCVAGLLAWTGAASFIELGDRMPVNGGIQEYIRLCYGDRCGFLAAWSLVLLIKPCSIAIMSLVFAEYLQRMFDVSEHTTTLLLKGVAIVASALMTSINCAGIRMSTGTAKAFLAVKVTGLGSVIILGLGTTVACLAGVGADDKSCFKSLVNLKEHQFSWAYTGSVTDAILTALWAYGGWDIVAGELQDPSRNIPRVLHSAMAIVISLFVLANAAYFLVLPSSALIGANTVALDFGRAMFGSPGALFYTWIVCLLSRSFERQNLHRWPFDRGRGWSAMASCASRTKQSFRSPKRAMLTNFCLALGYIILGSFRSLVVLSGMVEGMLVCAAISGLVLLRVQGHGKRSARTYRTCILNPFVFCCLGAAIIVRTLAKNSIFGIATAAFYGTGLVVYQWRVRLMKLDGIQESQSYTRL